MHGSTSWTNQLQCDLQPLKKGSEAKELVFSLPVDKILSIKFGDCEKPAMSDSHCHDLPNELKELLDKFRQIPFILLNVRHYKID
jgi:hypothetical protein